MSQLRTLGCLIQQAGGVHLARCQFWIDGVGGFREIADTVGDEFLFFDNVALFIPPLHGVGSIRDQPGRRSICRIARTGGIVGVVIVHHIELRCARPHREVYVRVVKQHACGTSRPVESVRSVSVMFWNIGTCIEAMVTF